METKKFYEQPEMEVVMLKMESPLLSGSGDPNNEEGEDEEGF